VIDSDDHILEPLTLWDDYIDLPFRERAPKVVVDTDGKQRLLIEEQVLGSRRGMGGLGGVGARQGAVSAETMSYEERRPGGFDRRKRIPDMDLDGIDAALLYPSMGLFAGAVHDPALAGAMCRAYHRWLADYCKPYPDRLFGIAMLPMQSVDHAIAEMRFARRELGFRGGFLRPNPTTTGCCTTRPMNRSGARPRISISRSASTRAATAACRRSASTASRVAALSTSSRIRWK
jgi:hypothetical protein